MKNAVHYSLISLVVLLLTGACPGTVFGQDVNSRIAAAIKTANARELSSYFNNTIDLTTPGNEGTYSKAQAEMIVKSFFSKDPPSSFTLNHNGKSNDGSHFAIGTYKSGATQFRAYFLVKVMSGQQLIHQLKFESEDD